MFESVSRGWGLTKASFRVLKLDKEIIALPLMSGALMILAAIVTFSGTALSFLAIQSDLVLYAGLFTFYLVTYSVAIFFNAAVIECAMIRFNGGDPVVKDGLRMAWSRRWRILQWALVAATVGLLLKILRGMAQNSRHPVARMVGQIAVAIAGAAWHIAAFFAVPMAVYKDVGPFEALKGSVSTVKRVFGEGVTGIVTTSIIFFLLGLVGIIPLVAGLYLLAAVSVPLGVLLLVVTVAYWVTLSAASTAVDGILVAALFKYAQDGQMPTAFADTEAAQPAAIAAV